MVEQFCAVNIDKALVGAGKFGMLVRLVSKLRNYSMAAAFVGIASTQAATIDFARDIQPIFVKRCFECHGPDKQKSGLRLDNKADAFKGGESGKKAIAAGQSAESEIIRRVTTDDADDVMPPKGARLEPSQITALRQWMDEGAIWPEKDKTQLWSFKKPTPPEVPTVKNTKWVHNDIDRFILARLEKEGLSPTDEADRHILIRRLSLDITGLPPTRAEVERFVNDRSPRAYEDLVDRLLESPHYGEHIGRWWLDLARYADSNGYQVDLTRSIWPYRDWVINAFNRNMPFDQFTVEQLAGDLLPNATLEQKIATGFNRNTKMNDEGGGDGEEYRTKAVKDRVATTSTTFLGLTMMCAECHTHKYDPITHDDYYRFYAFFNNTADGGNYSLEPMVPVPAPDVQPKVAFVRAQIAKVRNELRDAEARLAKDMAAWEKRIAGKTNIWKVLDLTNANSVGGATLTNLADGSVLATGLNAMYDTVTFDASSELKNITAVLLETLPDPSLPHNGPGRWGKTGNFILDEFGMYSGGTNLVFRKATADWEQQYYRAEHAVDRNPKSGWAIGPKFGMRHFLIGELQQPIPVGDKLSFRFEQYHGNNHVIGRTRLSVTTETDPEALWPLEPEVVEILAISADQRSTEQAAKLAKHFRTISPKIRKLERELFRLNEREMELASAKYTTLVMLERPDKRETYIHQRGDFLSKGKIVTAGVPMFLPPLSTNGPANRLALARWIVGSENPLTARVTVNRLWERFFGVGLVKTSDDLGWQGEAPSHPELLDFLAVQFSRNWDFKAMQKMIVMSAAYRQSAEATEAALKVDPYNRLIARGPRFRLEPEAIRDQALAVSGLLNPAVGGPSVYPVQPANLWKELGFLRPEIGMDEWPVSEGPDLYRRGVYTFWRRVATYPLFATFDAPTRELCTAKRPRTNTPLQALAALNESTLMEAARVFAQRILAEGGATPAKKIEFAFELCTARPPTRFERTRLLKFLDQQIASFEKDPPGAQKIISIGSAEYPKDVDATQLAAWTMTANVLLNLDETLTKE
jgi:mono/diheme cytochrome c family protein